MQAIKDWIRANPDQGRELMRENLSYVFFKEIPGSGPLGRARRAGHAAARPSPPTRISCRSGRRSTSMTPIAGRSTACGWRRTSAARSRGRTDSIPIWGAGAEAAAIAGGMSANGEALILVPKGVAARALAQP